MAIRFPAVLLLSVLLLSALPARAQLTLTGSSPANLATSVPTNSVLSLTFSGPLDTNAFFGEDMGLLSNVDSVTGIWYSADARTVYFQAVLKPSTKYCVVVYGAPGAGGAKLARPVAMQFTTASAFPSPSYSVSGTVSPGSTGTTGEDALVILSPEPFNDQRPQLFGVAVTGPGGAFTIDKIPNGVYYPIAAKDIDRNGQIDPSGGDGLGFADSVVVNGGNAGGVVVTLFSFGPMPFTAARDSAVAMAARQLPSDRVLRLVETYDADSTGKSGSWRFNYTSSSSGKGYRVRINTFSQDIEEVDAWTLLWFSQIKPFTGLASAAAPDSFVARAERAGGKAFRQQTRPPGIDFELSLQLGDISRTDFWGTVPDTSHFFWGASYMWVEQPTPDSMWTLRALRFVGDYTTGTILRTTGVEQTSPEIPDAFALEQNYPNPFNPATTLRYTLPVGGAVTVEVYNMLGQRVDVLFAGKQQAGTHELTWKAEVPSGVYLCRLEAAGANGRAYLATRKMVLLR